MAGNSALKGLLDELRKNSRLRLGVWLIAAVFGFYLVLLARDELALRSAEHQRLAAHLQRLQAVASQPEWPERAEQAKAWREALGARLWRADSRGLAQAQVQSWLDLNLMFAQLGEPSVRVEPAIDVPEYPELWQVTSQVRGGFTPAALEGLLQAVAGNDKLILVERLEINNHVQRPRVTLTLRAYFQAPAATSSTNDHQQ